MKTSTKLAITLFAWLALATHSAVAHELVIKPDTPKHTPDQSLGLSVYTTEVYLQPGRIPPEATRLTLYTANGSQPIPTHRDEAGKRLTAALPPLTDPALYLLAHSEREKNAKSSTDKILQTSFAKAVINAEGHSAYGRTLGARLEIVLLNDPNTLRIGQTMRVKILYEGKPVAAKLLTSYDGFSDEEHAYTTRGQSDANGLATFTVTAPGLWMARTKLNIEAPRAGIAREEISASLVFSVQP